MLKHINESNQKCQEPEPLSLLVGGIAYNINKILASILGNLEIVEMYVKKEAKLMNRLIKAEDAVARAKDLTQQLLDLSKTEEPWKRPVSVEGFLREKEIKKEATRQRKILLMDDEEMVLESTGDLLQEIGYTVELAKNGAEVVRLYKEARQTGKPFDVVVLDLEVPGGQGGQDTIRELRKVDPEVKAVISSGYTADPIMEKHKEYGFVSALCKPYRMKELNTALKEALAEQPRV